MGLLSSPVLTLCSVKVSSGQYCQVHRIYSDQERITNNKSSLKRPQGTMTGCGVCNILSQTPWTKILVYGTGNKNGCGFISISKKEDCHFFYAPSVHTVPVSMTFLEPLCCQHCPSQVIFIFGQTIRILSCHFHSK